VLTLCILLFVTPMIFGQKRAPNVRLSKAHPSVYMTFDHQAKIASMRTGEIEDTVWLRLRNNTRWPIILDMNGVPSKAYGDAALFWDVLCKGNEPDERRCHACSFNPLPPGHYILFTVPREDLAKDCSIRVKFSYGWEDSSGETGTLCLLLQFCYTNEYPLTGGAVEQIVGPEPREATFASSVIRLSRSVAPWPGQLNRCAPYP